MTIYLIPLGAIIILGFYFYGIDSKSIEYEIDLGAKHKVGKYIVKIGKYIFGLDAIINGVVIWNNISEKDYQFISQSSANIVFGYISTYGGPYKKCIENEYT